MKKSIRDNKVCFVCESIEEARRLLTALDTTVPFFTQHQDAVFEIKNFRNVSITLIAEADVREVSEDASVHNQ